MYDIGSYIGRKSYAIFRSIVRYRVLYRLRYRTSNRTISAIESYDIGDVHYDIGAIRCLCNHYPAIGRAYTTPAFPLCGRCVSNNDAQFRPLRYRRPTYDIGGDIYDIVRYRVRYPYDIGRKIVRLFALIVRYLYVIAPYIGRTSAVHRSYIALVRCTLHLPQLSTLPTLVQ